MVDYYIPFSIQGEILERLPTKSLMRFRSVCKQWKSLIDSSSFIVDYSFKHTHQEHLLVGFLVPQHLKQKYVSFLDVNNDDTFPHEKLSLPLPIPGLTQPSILGSSQGLFCLCNITEDPCEPGKFIRKAVLWNPSVRKSVAIAVPDLLDRLFVLGFGVCPHTRDPKLVNINFTSSLSNRRRGTIVFSHWRVEVYTLSSGAWRSISTTSQPPHYVNLLWQQVVTDDGFIYWLAIDSRNINTTTTEFQGYNMIVSFDLTSENFMEVPLPGVLACADNRNVVISKLKKSLAVLEISREAKRQVYRVWMMERGVPNTFTKLFSIKSPDVCSMLGFKKNNQPIFGMTIIYEALFDMGNDDDDDDDDVLELESEPQISPVQDVFAKLYSEPIDLVMIFGDALALSASSYMETLLLFEH